MSSFSCNMCSYVFKNSSNLRRHFITCHTNTKTFMCNKCNQNFKRSDHLKRHYDTHFKNKLTTLCGLNGCKKSFSDVDKLNAHRELHRKKLEEEVQLIGAHLVKREMINDSFIFTCPIDGCNNKFNSYLSMYRHIKFHTDPEKLKELRKKVKIHTCEKCSKTFTKKIRLKNHLEKIHSQPDQETQSEQLETKVVNDNKVFICPYEECRRIYSKKSNVKMHIVRNHTKEVYFKCDDCGCQFLWKKSLDSHKCKNKT